MIRPRKWYVHRGVVALTALAFCSLPKPQLACGAQDAAAKAEEEKWAVDRSLSLSPRSETAPALKHRLFPMAVDLKEGNAVPIYLRLVHEQNDEARKLWRDKSAEWNKLPLDKLPLAEARKFLDDRKYMMKQLDLGARRTSAEWNYTLDAGDPIGLLLPDAQGMRIYGSLLTLKARVELAEGNYAAATQTLQTGFAMSRHVAEGPFLVNGLVAVAVATQLADVLLDWVSRADAPNLYWSITALPRPLIDFR